MGTPLRLLPDGTRFMLCRTREKYELLQRLTEKGKVRYIVRRDGSECDSSLHHSCHVKPLVRATAN